MTKMLEDIKFSDRYSKKDLLEAIECLQHNYKGLKETYDRAVCMNYKLAEIYDKLNRGGVISFGDKYRKIKVEKGTIRILFGDGSTYDTKIPLDKEFYFEI